MAKNNPFRPAFSLSDELLEKIYAQDLTDRTYPLFCSCRRSIDLSIHDGRLTLACEDWDAGGAAFSGRDEYEFYYDLDERATVKFLACLRKDRGCDAPLCDLLKERFGKDDGTVRFDKFCRTNGIAAQFFAP